MTSDDKEGSYCSICGGISPGKIKTKCITVRGKEIGIDRLDQIILEVRALNLSLDDDIVRELLKRVKLFNYVPTVRSNDYGEALLSEYEKGG
jgi:hypothetical protein